MPAFGPAVDVLFTPMLEGDEARMHRCRAKAEEYRTLADTAVTEGGRETFLDLARCSDRLADEAERRLRA